MPETMPAAGLVALADEIVGKQYDAARRIAFAEGGFLNVVADNKGQAAAYMTMNAPGKSATLYAELTPETTSSPRALKRALLESRITVRRADGTHHRSPYFYATLPRDTDPAHPLVVPVPDAAEFARRYAYAEGKTEAEARNALLDALLAPSEPETARGVH